MNLYRFLWGFGDGVSVIGWGSSEEVPEKILGEEKQNSFSKFLPILYSMIIYLGGGW